MYLSTATVLDTDFAFKTFKISMQESQAQSKNIDRRSFGISFESLKRSSRRFFKRQFDAFEIKILKIGPFF
jgi:hypothetical protein